MKPRSFYVMLVLNAAIAYACIAIGFAYPSYVLSIPELRQIYSQALQLSQTIPPGPAGFGRYAYIQLQSLGGSAVLAAVTVFSSCIDVAVDSLLRGVYLSQNLSMDPASVASLAIELSIDVFSSVLTLSAASAIGIELWRALLTRSRVYKHRMLFLLELVAVGLAIQCIYIPALSSVMP